MDQPKKPTAPMVQVENVPLEHFEALVRARNHEEAGRELIRDLQRLKIGGEFVGQRMDDDTRPGLYTRLASAIAALLSDRDLHLSFDGFEALAADHATLDAVFQASRFGNADHLLRQFGSPDRQDPDKIHFTDPQAIAKILLSYSLDSGIDIDFEAVLRAAPRHAAPAFIGMLAQHAVCSPAAHRRREQLLALGPLLEQVDLGAGMLITASNAYMHSTYASSENKHDIKRSINRLMRRAIERQVKLPGLPVRRKAAARPTILIPVEQFFSLHAMYRCYAPSIRRLKERFRIVMIGRSSAIDEVSKQLFDDVIELDGAHVSVADVIGKAGKIAPDIVYYPSVGMAAWCVALSTVRLAPIQLLTLGHPATTNSEAIDYVIVPQNVAGSPRCFSEIAVQIEGFPSMVMREDATFPAPVVRRAPDVLRLGVPSAVYKLNAPFLATCRSIAARSSRPIEFHFFPNVVRLFRDQAEKAIHNYLPAAVVQARSDYDAYLRNLARCDLHLSTFPFGGTNSNIDSMKLGIPMVTLETLEPPGQFDAAMLRAIGAPESLIARDPGGYERAVLQLIEDDGKRCALAEQLVGTDVDAVFMDRGEHRYNADFLAALQWIYLSHESIQSSGRRYWTVEDRRSFSDPAPGGPR